MKYYYLISLLFLTSCQNHLSNATSSSKGIDSFSMKSDKIKDDYFIKVSLPTDYEISEEKYPVIFLLDANLYFDIFAQALEDYGNVGLSPKAILVGIGYKDINSMDSLRQRDYTYPTAFEEYEMAVSGGADKFLEFLEDKLYSKIAHKYRIDQDNVILFGHSLGGYFTLYSYLKGNYNHLSKINKFIAASPSLHYNNYYLLSQLANNRNSIKNNGKLYISYGGLEASDDPTTLSLRAISDSLYKHINKKRINFDIYSNLDHMDTQFPTFFKGINSFNITKN